jgi:DNA-binding CsgD family transcriptional regulator
MRPAQELETEGFILLRKRFGALLSERELEVASLAISGISTASIADRLFLSVNTVKTHMKNILKKTKASSRIDLYRMVAEVQGAHTGGWPRVPSCPDSGKTHTRLIFQVDGDAEAIPAMICYLSGAIRTGDRLLPYAADGIQVLLSNTTLATASQVARRLCRHLQEWGERNGIPLKIQVKLVSGDSELGTG